MVRPASATFSLSSQERIGLLAALFQGCYFTAVSLTSVSLATLLTIGSGPTAAAYTLYFRGLRTAAASTAALLSLLEPLTGTLLSALILGDRLGITGLAGAAILAAAVVLTVRAHGRPLPGTGFAGQASRPALRTGICGYLRCQLGLCGGRAAALFRG
jgi:drug/metabolite transporter (DMT)-like permease